MKTKLILLFLFLFTIQKLHSQDLQQQVVHKYLTIQGWDVVRHEHPEVINTEMDYAMRNPTNNNFGDYWASIYDGYGDFNAVNYKGRIVTGSFREDIRDVVWLQNNIIVPLSSHPFASITHFWDADVSDSYEPYIYGVRRNNSYQKANAYWYGSKPNGESWLHLVLSYGTLIFEIEDKYHNLAQAYINNDLFVVTRWRHYIEGSEWKPEPNIPLVNYLMTEPYPTFTELEAISYVKSICWEIIGRTCHLIEDQGVPAHTHLDLHPYFDTYEDCYIGGGPNGCSNNQSQYLSWNFQSALNGGGSINLIGKTNPIRYALYTANQVSDRYPSDDKDGDTYYETNHSDNYQQILSPIYQNIPFGINHFNNNPPAGLMLDIGNNSYVYSIRVIAGYLYWVYQQFNQPPIAPTINSITYTNLNSSVDEHKIYSSESGLFACNASGPNLTYEWNLKVDGRSIWECGDTLPGLLLTGNGNNLTISNLSFINWWTNSRYATAFCPSNKIRGGGVSNSASDPPLFFTVEVRVSNIFGTVTSTYVVNNFVQSISPFQGIRPPPNPPGGCPFLFVYNGDSSKNIIDNNILHRSENPEFAGQDIEDKYLLTVKPGLINNKFSLGILEPEGDYSYFDNIKLYAIDHSIWQRIVITENNDIACYDTRTVISSEFAYRNLSEVTSYIQFDTAYPELRRLVSGISNDSVTAEYSSEKILNINKKFRGQNIGDEPIIDSLAIIAEIGQNENDAPINTHIVKDYAGSMTIDAKSDSYQKFFSRRENNSPIVIPFSNGYDAASNIDIKWFRNYEFVYLSVVYSLFRLHAD